MSWTFGSIIYVTRRLAEREGGAKSIAKSEADEILRRLSQDVRQNRILLFRCGDLSQCKMGLRFSLLPLGSQIGMVLLVVSLLPER